MADQVGYYEIALTGNALFAGGEIAAAVNPEGVALVITDAKLIVDTPSTGAANINVGVNSSATTSDTDMVNALAINGAITGVVYHAMTALAAKDAALLWPAGYYITATGSASSAGFTGRLFVKYLRLA